MFLRADTMMHTAATIFAVACDFYDSDVLILKNVASNNVVANRQFLFAEVVREVTGNVQRALRYFFSAGSLRLNYDVHYYILVLVLQNKRYRMMAFGLIDRSLCSKHIRA